MQMFLFFMRIACTCAEEGISQVLSWGYNGYGELGIGDTQIRTVPQVLTCFKRNRIRAVSAGPRHTLFLAYHKPLVAKEEPDLKQVRGNLRLMWQTIIMAYCDLSIHIIYLKQYFSVIEEGITTFMLKRLKADLTNKGQNPKDIDDPEAVIPGQPGSTAEQSHNDLYEPGTLPTTNYSNLSGLYRF